MRCALLALALVLTTISPARACWAALDPGGYAQGCPIIIKGTIVAVAEPGQGKGDDALAAILIEEIQKNELKDVPLKVGDYFHARMVSLNRRVRTSIDLNYPLKTRAVWLVALTSKGEF